MFVGYLTPDGKVFDKKWKFTKIYGLDADEKIIGKDDTFHCGCILTGWKSSGRGVFEGGEGTLIKTNKKIIFMGSRRPMEEFRGFFPVAIVKVLQLRKLRNKGIREYFEIPLVEIYGQRKGIIGPERLCILHNDKKYSLGLPKKSEILDDLLKRKI